MDAALLQNAEFSSVDMDGWRALAEKALRGGSFEEELVDHSDDGIALGPLFEPAEPRLLTRGKPNRNWSIVQRIDDPDVARAREQIETDLQGGASGLALVFEGAPNAFGYGLPAQEDTLSTLLEGLPVNDISLRIDVHPASRKSMDWLVENLSNRPIDPSKLDLSFGIDSAAVFGGTGRLRMSLEALAASLPQSLAHFFAMQVPGVLLEADGRVYHNAGATEAQELGAMAATAIAHLSLFEEARQPVAHAAPHIGFALSATHDQYLTIAKIRALRMIWARLLEECEVSPIPAHIHAETSFRTLATKDPETNILRNTVAAFSAAVGGADSVSILPHTITHGLPDPFARRLARNTQLLLRDESNLGFVSDPAAGSGGMEQLTDELAEAGWEEMRKLQTEGGLLLSLRDGAFQKRVVASRNERAKAYREGKRTIVGTTLHPLEEERAVQTTPAAQRPVPEDGSVFCERLVPLLIAETLEGDAA
ncbi:methylmalonyl-CoA mutase family protein [Notoacmeibacter sp. MSK16QG-6]|uniref:methylmalonyl-CoA mutase family protein n=1 Tax=Notoacmeibacter sp. MSK16QG-6 TaxID=2957982 RepID=UPI00209FE645|nr:methylmalonyl-CoA mutase family protein [Notoacmeibacter sp. MSK16QG-6]MCP1198171.1 methylmalonyl-CoA mutase family protein [Notoacmeibacter sp. MSK16QG-6]